MTYIQVDKYGNIIKLLNSTQVPEGASWIETSVPNVGALTHYYLNNQVIAYAPDKCADRMNFKYGYIWIPELGWVDERTTEMKYQENNTLRLQYLADSDWTQLPDVDIPNKTEWATYRQQLRDMDYQDIVNGNFPTLPQS